MEETLHLNAFIAQGRRWNPWKGRWWRQVLRTQLMLQGSGGVAPKAHMNDSALENSLPLKREKEKDLEESSGEGS